MIVFALVHVRIAIVGYDDINVFTAAVIVDVWVWLFDMTESDL